MKFALRLTMAGRSLTGRRVRDRHQLALPPGSALSRTLKVAAGSGLPEVELIQINLGNNELT